MISADPKFFEDLADPIGTWRNLKPNEFLYPVSDLWMSIIVALSITTIHVLLDFVFRYRAELFAERTISRKQVTRPKWIPSKMTALTYNKLQWLNPRSFRNIVPKKYEQFSSAQQTDLILFQKACAQHSKQISKYQEALFKCVVFGTIWLYGLGLLWFNGRWYWDSEWMWAQGIPQAMGDHPIFNLRVFYILQIGYAAHRGYYQFFEHSRKDFWAMFIHHWVAVGLLVGSYTTGFCQIGATVLLTTDQSDLYMPMGKLASYEGYTKIDTLGTVVFVVTWIPFRIGVYFYKVLWSCICGYSRWGHLPSGWVLVIGLWVIYSLQFIWTKYLLVAIYAKVFKGAAAVADVRSDDEGECNKPH